MHLLYECLLVQNRVGLVVLLSISLRLHSGYRRAAAMSKYAWSRPDSKATHVVIGRIWFPTGCWRADLSSSPPVCWRLLSVLAKWASYRHLIIWQLALSERQMRKRERTGMQDRSHILKDLVTQWYPITFHILCSLEASLWAVLTPGGGHHGRMWVQEAALAGIPSVGPPAESVGSARSLGRAARRSTQLSPAARELQQRGWWHFCSDKPFLGCDFWVLFLAD